MARFLIIEKWHLSAGGVEKVNQNLAMGMQHLGHDTVFYVYHTTAKHQAGYEALSKLHITESPPQKASFFTKLKHLFQVVKHRQIDGIIAATETANVLAFFCALRYRHLQVLYTRHCAFEVADQSLSPFMIKCLYNLYALSGGQLGGVSKRLVEDIKKSLLWRKKAVRYYPNAVVGKHLDYAAQEDSHNPYILSNYVCAVGRLSEQKGFDLLLNAMATARNLLPNGQSLPKLVIVGDGELYSPLKTQCSALGLDDTVEFHGYAENPYNIIKRAQALLVSSRHEGMPTVIIEALYLGTPVISFDCPTGPSEVIENGKNGQLIENGKVEQFAQAIAKAQWKDLSSTKSSVAAFEIEQAATTYVHRLLEPPSHG